MTDRRKPQHAGTRQHCSVHRTAPVTIHLIHAAHGASFDAWTKTVTLHGGPGDERQLMVDGRFWRLLRKH